MSHTAYPPARQRLQRSELAVPGSNPGMFDKAANSDVDYVFLDLEDAVAPAASAQDAQRESTIVEYAADGSISRPQLTTVFGMELGTIVTLKHLVQTGGATLVYHIAKMDGPTVTLVGTDENFSQATTTVGELVDLY